MANYIFVPKEKTLLFRFPKIASEWDSEKNLILSPNTVSAGSEKKAWWICSNKKHSYEAMIKERTGRHKTGCPFCSGNKVCSDNCLATISPEIAKTWHPKKNGVLTPYDITASSKRIAYWICEKGHEWEASPDTRQKNGCGICSGRIVSNENCLATINPKLAKEWHPTKNKKLTPNDVTSRSKKKIWWKCKKGHEWETTVGDRHKGKGCAKCSKRVASEEYNLLLVYPQIASEWHPTKNGNLRTENILPSSVRKAWWICSVDKNHEYEARVGNRTLNGSNCPYCCNQKAGYGNTIDITHPEISKDWDDIKNKTLKTTNATYGIKKKVHWKCYKNHEIEETVAARVKSQGCKMCSKQLPSPEYNLATEYPEVVPDWDVKKNEHLKPTDVLPMSGQKVWWKCQKGHSLHLSPTNRLKYFGCNECNKSSQSSFPELYVYASILKLFPNAKHRYKIEEIKGKPEVDIFLPGLTTVIEYDGYFWHKDKDQHDRLKSETLTSSGIKVIRIREKGLKEIEECQNFMLNSKSLKNLKEVTKNLLFTFGADEAVDNLLSEIDTREIKAIFTKTEKDRSLAIRKPEIAKYWHKTKNVELTPEHVSYGCHYIAWWQCENNKEHVWEREVNRMTSGNSKCPLCSQKRKKK